MLRLLGSILLSMTLSAQLIACGAEDSAEPSGEVGPSDVEEAGDALSSEGDTLGGARDASGPPGPPGDAMGPGPGQRGLRHGFFAVHLDPGANPGLADGTPDPSRPKAHFDELSDLVEAADVHGHKLTLMFTAQWAAHMVSPLCEPPADALPPEGAYTYASEAHSTCLSLIRAFEAQGHEIAFHHHPEVAPASWDGFSNQPGDELLPGYLGTVDALLAYVSALPAMGPEAITAGTTEEYPQGTHYLRVMSARGPTPYVGPDALGDLASRPCSWFEDGNHVWRVRMRGMTPTLADELDRAYRDLAEAPEAYTVGFVTHAKDVDGALETYVALFTQLDALGLTLQGLSAAVGNYPYTQGDPASDTAHGCPEDEALDMDKATP